MVADAEDQVAARDGGTAGRGAEQVRKICVPPSAMWVARVSAAIMKPPLKPPLIPPLGEAMTTRTATARSSWMEGRKSGRGPPRLRWSGCPCR